MRTVVVTGGIAAGKTTVCQLFQQYSPAVAFFDCDASVHELLTKSEIKEKLKSEFGDSILDSKEEIDRPRLGDIVFSDAGKRKSLEGVLHPEVLKLCLDAKEKASIAGAAPFFLADVPLFYEVDFPIEADEVFVVAASKQTRLRRLRERGGLDAESAERLITLQMPLEEKIRKANRVIWNEGHISTLRKQVHYATLIAAETYG